MWKEVDPEQPVTERMLLDVVRHALQKRLPETWIVGPLQRPTARDSGIDAILSLSSPQATPLRIAVEAKRIVQPRDVLALRDRLDPARGDKRWDIGLVAARYLSQSVREHLIAAGLSFADATGNICIRSDALPLFIADRGSDNDPWRGPGRPRGTLKGAPAAQVVRALLDAPGPWRMRDLVSAAQASTGSAYRVIEFLETEDLAVRNDDATVSVRDWVSVLRRWSADYEFLTTNAVSRWIAPRGVDSVIRAAQGTDSAAYVMTGSVAAATWAPYAPVRSVMAYATDTSEVAETWGLRATDAGANVLLAEPAYLALTRGARLRADGVMVAAPTQAVADLLTGPGRAPSEAEALIDWMVANEREWRRRE